MAPAPYSMLARTPFSPPYAADPRMLEREARVVFPGAVAAHDGIGLDIPFADEPQEGAAA